MATHSANSDVSYDPGPRLPAGWTARWHPVHRQWYYINCGIFPNEYTWQHPRMAQAPGSLPSHPPPNTPDPVPPPPSGCENTNTADNDDNDDEEDNEEPGPAPASQPDQAVSAARVAFSALELQQMVTVTTQHNPYLAPRSRRGETWAAVLRDLQSQGLCLTSSVRTIQNKVKALLEHHRNSNPRSEISKALDRHASIKAQMPALLDRLTGAKQSAAKVAEEQKDQVREDSQRKVSQGEHIRKMSLITMTRHSATPEEGSPLSKSDPTALNAGRQRAALGNETHSGTPTPGQQREDASNSDKQAGNDEGDVDKDGEDASDDDAIRIGNKENTVPQATPPSSQSNTVPTPTRSTPKKRKRGTASTPDRKGKRRRVRDGGMSDLMTELQEARDEDRRAREQEQAVRQQRDDKLLAFMRESQQSQAEFQKELIQALKGAN
ncbi:hypothetical protein OH76DRAFT_1503083 [Lentinus brumalis]|uniref:WW domain-containing protein n=1 Tax=Lentinus brumalis TaxID=2498619 RepID=A0A371CLH2_9APHY|nr:hypothetical protein OH76DRAFT_1503083 [Polyporus brumalis]